MFYWAAPRASARCPLVEDQALIGMALEAYLEDAGYEVAGPFGTCAAALASLDTQTPQVAVIDYRLQDGCCLKVVRVVLSSPREGPRHGLRAPEHRAERLFRRGRPER